MSANHPEVCITVNFSKKDSICADCEYICSRCYTYEKCSTEECKNGKQNCETY